MIFLDTNVILRFLTPPSTLKDAEWQAISEALFASVESGEEDVTTSEVVLHEVAFILGAKKHYNLPVSKIVTYLTSFLQIPGLKLPRGDKQLYLRAVDIYATNPKLGYGDSIIAARAERLGATLATFDEALGHLDFVTRWKPSQLPNR